MKQAVTRGRIRLALVAALLCAPAGCGSHDDRDHERHGHRERHVAGTAHAHAAESADAGEPTRGPYGGRIVGREDLSLEIVFRRRGHTGRFYVRAYDDGQPIAPALLDVTLRLARLGDGPDDAEVVHFKPRQTFLSSRDPIAPPFSYDVTVNARYEDRSYSWSFPAYRDRTVISAEAAAESGITVARAGPAMMTESVEVHGRVVPNQDRVLHVTPRYPGVVQEVRKQLGESVEAGETLAVVESNQSLERYDVRSGISGSVIVKHLAPGEFVHEDDEIYIIADLSTVWVDFDVYRRYAATIRPGLAVEMHDAPEGAVAEAVIEYVSPYGARSTQTLIARAELANLDGSWRPGMFVSGRIAISEGRAAVTVDRRALQTLEGETVVFIRDGDVYEARPVKIGRGDADRVEIVAGLEAGREYVVENSFIVKSDLGKHGAEHSH